jgi:hypothetical protein
MHVADVKQLLAAARDICPGGTILLADGCYRMPHYFELNTDRISLRNASGDRGKVVLDAAESRYGELVGLRAYSGATIADLTIQDIRHNGFKLSPDSGIHGVTIRDRAIHNIWQRGLKGVRVPAGDSRIKPPKTAVSSTAHIFQNRGLHLVKS